jgi:hypothetical protein
MARPYHLWVDQYGQMLFARTVKELHGQVGRGKVFRIYADKRDGRTVHVGYGIGHRWFNRYAPVEFDIGLSAKGRRAIGA